MSFSPSSEWKLVVEVADSSNVAGPITRNDRLWLLHLPRKANMGRPKRQLHLGDCGRVGVNSWVSFLCCKGKLRQTNLFENLKINSKRISKIHTWSKYLHIFSLKKQNFKTLKELSAYFRTN